MVLDEKIWSDWSIEFINMINSSNKQPNNEWIQSLYQLAHKNLRPVVYNFLYPALNKQSSYISFRMGKPGFVAIQGPTNNYFDGSLYLWQFSKDVEKNKCGIWRVVPFNKKYIKLIPDFFEKNQVFQIPKNLFNQLNKN